MKIDTHKHTPAQVCTALGISKPTLIRWAKNPQFPQPLRMSRQTIRYDLEAIKRHVCSEAA